MSLVFSSTEDPRIQSCSWIKFSWCPCHLSQAGQRAQSKEEPGNSRDLQGTCWANEKKYQIMNKPPGEKNLRKKKYRAILAPAPLLACPSLWNQCISWRTESASTGPPPALLWPSSGTPYLMTAWGWGARHSLLGEGKRIGIITTVISTEKLCFIPYLYMNIYEYSFYLHNI